MAIERMTRRAFRLLNGVNSLAAPESAARRLERLFLTPGRSRLRPEDAAKVVEAQRTSVHIDEARSIPLYAWGSGPPVLLVHGWSGRGGQLAAFVAPLVSAGYSVVAFDAPGHGAATPGLSGLPELARVVELVAAEVDEVHGIVAHSLGTSAATVALAGGLEARRVVYLAPPDEPPEYLYRVGAALGFTHAVARRTQTLIEKRFDAPFDALSGTALAARLSVPALMIHDTEDRDVPHGEGVRLAGAWNAAELVSTTGLGHVGILRDPGVVEMAVRFIASE